MKNKKFRVLLISSGVFFLMVTGCAKSSTDTSYLYIPSQSDVTTKATLQDLQKGRDLFINNCGACHAYPTPENYSSSQWQTIMAQMAPKTSMTSSEVQLVLKYVTKGN